MKKIIFLMLSCVVCFSSCDNKVTILGEDSSNIHALQKLQEECEKENELKLAFRPNSFDEAYNKANQDFINHSGLYDIIMQYNFSLSSYIENNYVFSLDTLLSMVGNQVDTSFESDIFPGAWKEVGWYYDRAKGKNVENIIKIGYPFATNTMLLVYNKEMFENPKNIEAYKKRYNGAKLAVPTDWDTFAQIAEFFTDAKADTYGVCMQGHKDSWLYYEYCVFLYGMGGSIFEKDYGWEGDKNTPITITSDNAIKATELYRKMKAFNKGAYTTVDAAEQVKLMLDGDNVAMALVWSDYLYRFLNKENTYKYGFAVLPGPDSPIAGGCFYINKDSKHPVEAMKYILYVMQPKVQEKLALQGLCSPLKSTYSSPQVKAKIKYSDALYESLDRGKYMFEAGVESNLVSEIVTKHIQRLWEDSELTVKETLRSIKKEIEFERAPLYKKNR